MSGTFGELGESMRRVRLRGRLAVGLSFAAVLVLGLAAWVVWPRSTPRLSPAERPLVGRWCRPYTLSAPGDGAMVLELTEGRTFRIGVFGPEVRLDAARQKAVAQLLLDESVRLSDALGFGSSGRKRA